MFYQRHLQFFNIMNQFNSSNIFLTYLHVLNCKNDLQYTSGVYSGPSFITFLLCTKTLQIDLQMF